MTRERDIERVVERWFADGPTQMPDRLFNTVLDRIDRVPQRRLARLQTRLLAMNFNVRLAVAAAIVVVIAGVGAFMLNRSSGVGVNPSPSPVITASPAPSAAADLPAELLYTWVGATRTVAQISPPITRSVLVLSSRTMAYNIGGNNAIWYSRAGLSSPGTVAFTTATAAYGCQVGDTGTYSFTLSGSTRGGGKMSLQPVTDACAARTSAISGDWVRAACQDPNGWCLGDLDPGTYTSMSFNPFVPSSAWTSDYAALTYTVPAGWTNPEDCDFCFRLNKPGGPDDQIILFSDVAAHSQDPSCPEIPEPGIAHAATAIATWLKGLPGLDATTPVPITVGGLSGTMLDISVASSWTRTCSFSNGDPVVTTFTHANGVSGFDWNVGGTAHERVILLDAGGQALLIEIDAKDKAAFDVLVAEAMPVIQSFQFKP